VRAAQNPTHFLSFALRDRDAGLNPTYKEMAKVLYLYIISVRVLLPQFFWQNGITTKAQRHKGTKKE
jgi:hypothetical protein